MSESFPLKTCGEVGLPVKGAENWYYGGRFSTGLKDHADLTALAHFLVSRFGEDALQLVQRKDKKTGELRETYVLIPPVRHIVEYAAELLDIAARGERISDEIFWDLVNPLLQRMWDQATLYERIRLVNEAEAHASAVMQKDVPDAVHTILYRTLEDL